MKNYKQQQSKLYILLCLFATTLLIHIILGSVSCNIKEPDILYTKDTLKIGDSYLGGYVYKKTGAGHGAVIINTHTYNIWDSARAGGMFPSCNDFDSIFKIQETRGIFLDIPSGVYWRGLKEIDKDYDPAYNRYEVVYPCSQVVKKSNLYIAYIKNF